MAIRYALAQKGQLSYGIESVPYTKEANPNQYFGYITDDVDLPNGQNPATPLAPGGTQRRGPHVWSPDEKEYPLSVPIKIYDHNIPLEVVFGTKAITDVENLSLVKVADKYTFTESPRLPTMTVQHANDELQLVEWFIGAKASLALSFSKGEFLTGTLDILAAAYDYVESTPAPSIVIPHAKTPFRMTHLGLVTVGAKTVATIKSGDFGLDNGLESQHHGNGRDPYSISEGVGAEKYGIKFIMNIVDLVLFKRAQENDIPVLVTFPFIRSTVLDGTVDDGLNIIWEDCRILKANLPNNNEGVIESEVILGPRNSKIEIITPV